MDKRLVGSVQRQAGRNESPCTRKGEASLNPFCGDLLNIAAQCQAALAGSSTAAAEEDGMLMYNIPVTTRSISRHGNKYA